MDSNVRINDRSQEDLIRVLPTPGQTGTESGKPLLLDPDRIRSILKGRKIRSEVFGENLFADPAWDILLVTALFDIQQRRLAVTKLLDLACVPQTTGLRWISALEERGLLMRENDPLDGRRVWISLTKEGYKRLVRYSEQVHQQLIF